MQGIKLITNWLSTTKARLKNANLNINENILKSPIDARPETCINILGFDDGNTSGIGYTYDPVRAKSSNFKKQSKK